MSTIQLSTVQLPIVQLSTVQLSSVQLSAVQLSMFQLPTDPAAAIAANNECRRANAASGEGICSASALAAAAAEAIYEFPSPTFTPPYWQRRRDLPETDEKYAERFKTKFPEAARALEAAHQLGVVVAGGAAAWPLGDRSTEPSDVDFFFYNTNLDGYDSFGELEQRDRIATYSINLDDSTGPAGSRRPTDSSEPAGPNESLQRAMVNLLRLVPESIRSTWAHGDGTKIVKELTIVARTADLTELDTALTAALAAASTAASNPALAASAAASDPVLAANQSTLIDMGNCGLAKRLLATQSASDEATPEDWARVAVVVDALTEALLTDASCVLQDLRPGVLTLTALYETDMGISMKKFQMVLRKYQTISALLHSFDVPSCAVAFDGQRAHLTALSAYAHAHRVNIVHPEYRSPSYEHRLIKYFERGYALVLPNLDMARLIKGRSLSLAHLVLTPDVVRSNYAMGTLTIAAGHVNQSDYAPPDPVRQGHHSSVFSLFRAVERARWGELPINMRALASAEWPNMSQYMIAGMPAFAVLGYVTPYENTAAVMSAGRRARWLLRATQGSPNRPIPLRAYAARGAPTLAEILPRDQLISSLQKAARANIDPRRMNAARVARLFGLRSSDIGELATAMLAASIAVASSPKTPLSIATALAPRIERLARAWDARPPVIDWWVRAPASARTGEQPRFTSSRQPTAETAAVWYGDAFDPDPQRPSSQAVIQILHSLRMNPATPQVFDGVCALCLESLQRGDLNSSILSCGHIFHWSSNGHGCGGLLRWAVEHEECPMCRAPFGIEAHQARVNSIELALTFP